MSPLNAPPAGRALWRSLDDLAGDPGFRELVGREFPVYADEMLAPSRRDFLKLMGASAALAGMTACRRWPVENIVPFAHRPDGYVEGNKLQFSTSYDRNGAALGLLVASFDGRPIKIEGNALHPASLGGTDPLAQGTLLQLYDPDRSTEVLEREAATAPVPRTRDAFTAWAAPIFKAAAAAGGAGLRVLAEPSSSPTLRALRDRFGALFPAAAWVEWDPLTRDASREGARLAFGRPLRAQLDLGKADVVAAFDADILLDDPAGVAHARAWAARRRAAPMSMNRMWVVEPSFTPTGTVADHRIAVQGGLVPVVLGRLAAKLLAKGVTLPAGCEWLREPIRRFETHPFDDPRIETLAVDLLAAAGKGAVVVGPRQPAAAHALGAALNVALGHLGAAVAYTVDPDPARVSHSEAIARLASDIGAGRIETLVILGGNPAYDAPADLGLAAGIGKVKNTIRLGIYDDETSALCRWHLPEAHYLEAWGDARGWDGTAGVVQPLIEPLYGGASAIELVDFMIGQGWRPGYELVRGTWTSLLPAGDFEKSWRRVVHDGVLAGSSAPPVAPAFTPGWGPAVAALADARPVPEGVVELVFARSPALHDGRFANCGWLMELPDPITKLTWDNAALMGPEDATALGVRSIGDVVTVRANGKELAIPAYILPGNAAGSVTVHLGWGRTRAGRVGDGVGVDVTPLRSSSAPWRVEARVAPAGSRIELATTQDHHVVDSLGKTEERVRAEELVRTGTLAQFAAHPGFAREMVHVPEDANLWTPHAYPGHKWGMAIDLTACIGCAACTIACQAENNIPIVGKKEVLRGREMHWIRVDRYFEGRPESPSIVFQPMACHHCETAPCEQVCPVAATVHDHEGLNVMVYNRCIGTRYCSNNCPYKVRRFNWFNNHKHHEAVEMMVFNPEVTVRARGVMEKCTYCVQRIEAVKILAKNEQRGIRDGEIVPACAQVCPTEAIAFGDLNDTGSRVRALHDDPRSYGVLEEVNTKPRTRYLARLRNPAKGLDEAPFDEGRG